MLKMHLEPRRIYLFAQAIFGGAFKIRTRLKPTIKEGTHPALKAYNANDLSTRIIKVDTHKVDKMLEKPDQIPQSPGVYIFRDEAEKILYVGKAKNLKLRVSSYFTNRSDLPGRTELMLSKARKVDWIELETETESFLLEQTLIKRYLPEFNVLLKDDKSYPFICLDLSSDWPRCYLYRGELKKGNLYFGPYVHAKSLRHVLNYLQSLYLLRSCSDSKFKRHLKIKSPCLLYHIKQCSGPCIGAISREDYFEAIEKTTAILSGKTQAIKRDLNEKMQRYAAELKFEQAALMRDKLFALEKISELQVVASNKEEDFDAIGLAVDTVGAQVQVFHVRNTHLVGTSGFYLDLAEDLNEEDLLSKVLEQIYIPSDQGPLRDVPSKLYVKKLPTNAAEIERVIAGTLGKNIKIRKASGKSTELIKRLEKNAVTQLKIIRTRRSFDIAKRTEGLTELKQYLDLKKVPYRIECYDCSHLSGTFYVGSMVVFEDGLRKTSQYRRFRLRQLKNDDYLAMKELLTRRLKGYEKYDSFKSLPDLIIVDGGKGQLSAAIKALEPFDFAKDVEICALAKSFEEIYRPTRLNPIKLPRDSEAFFQVVSIRDEAHRFAIEYNRKLRVKSMSTSVLESVPGIGKKRALEILRHYKDLEVLNDLPAEKIASEVKIPMKVILSLKEKLK